MSVDLQPRSDTREGVLAPVRRTFRAVACVVVPEAVALDERKWAEVEAVVEEALRARPPRLRRQLQLLLRLIDVMPVVRHGRRFSQLEPMRQTAVLVALQDSPVLLLRRGFWGLRTLVLMGYYARPGAAAEIGYRAHPLGWEARS